MIWTRIIVLLVGMARLLVDEFAVLIKTEVWSAGEYDDADPVAYENRVQAYRDSNSRLAVSDESEDVVFEGGFRVPADIYNRLFDYQKTGMDTFVT